ncbi:YncE family protein [Nonomuraea rubra]|uniref:YncE family protein n=1 Tax=Nonomuraea rubra TaxID=46180 RepID=UPI0033D69968
MRPSPPERAHAAKPLVTRLTRQLVALGGALAVAAGFAAVQAPPASAANSTTYLGNVGRGGDVAAGGGKVFVAADNRIIVADAQGALTGAITGLSGAVGLAMTPDGTRLYAALSDSNQVAEIDTAALTVTRRIDLTAYPCPSSLALSGSSLFVGHGCGKSWDGGALSLDLSATSPEPVRITANLNQAPLVTAAGNTLVVGETGISPADLFVYDGTASPATLRGVINSSSSYLRDLAITPDGSMVVSAFEAPYIFDAWDTTSLTKARTYGTGPTIEGHPVAVAISSDGAHVAGALGPARFAQTGPDVALYDAETTTKTNSNDNPIGEVAPGGLAFAGTDLFVVLKEGYNGPRHLWRLHGALLPASTLTLTAPSQGTALEPLTLTGQLTLSSGAPPGAQPLIVTRRHPDGTSAKLEDVGTAVDGTFSVTDAPTVGGTIRYDVLWDGDSNFRWNAASVTVSVTKRQASLTMSGPATGVAGKQLQFNGALDVDGKPVPAGTVFTVTRTVSGRDGTVTTTLPSVAPAGDGSFSFTDTPAEGGQHTYTVRLSDDTFLPAQASHEITVRGGQG